LTRRVDKSSILSISF